MAEKASFTGRTRRRTTSRSVRFADTAARTLISIGGIGTILSVLLVCFFLVSVAVPLFSGATVSEVAHYTPPWSTQAEQSPLRIGQDEYQSVGWALLPSGALQVFRADTGAQLQERPLFEGEDTRPTAVSSSVTDGSLAIGLADGSVRVGSIAFSTRFFDVDQVPKEFRDLRIGQFAPHAGGLLERTGDDQFRLQSPAISFDEPLRVAPDQAIRQLDHLATDKTTLLCTVTENGAVGYHTAERRKNLLTGKVTVRLDSVELPKADLANNTQRGAPHFVKILGRGDTVVVAWDDGYAVRYDKCDTDKPRIAERFDFVAPMDMRLTSLELLLGRSTLLAGDNRGGISVWFTTRTNTGIAADQRRLIRVRDLPTGPGAVTAIATSSRERVIAAGYETGAVRMFYITGGQQLTQLKTIASEPVTRLAVAPKADGLLAATRSKVFRWDTDLGYPEVTMQTLFGRTWYEGYDRPEYVWQSSSGTQDSELKLSMVPLVFGTLKATLYSMMFGTPLALFAAIYSNAFLTSRNRSLVKPTIELMASLPSVVLGFLAAMVIAPLVERDVPIVLALFVTLPLALLFGARFWQLLPRPKALELVGWRLPLIVVVALPIGFLAAVALGPVFEAWLFAGDIKRWLDGQIGSGFGAWFLLLLPSCGLALMLLGGDVNKWLRTVTGQWTHTGAALAEMVKFALGTVAMFLSAIAVAWLLTEAGFDPRGTFVGTYDQRNAMVVGFMMGFAIIPIIYTIADDALSSVPDTLRSASLGCGATPWQTTIGIIVPTAMSGLFSAVMIGLGRAVGETMIVLMAAGNTPVMSWNIFNGLRTMSANIAVELPEAVKNSTHYRTLYLSALILFAMTFVVNTLAETVRMRFRKRAFQL
jgi:phosphate transport system permease protein